MLHGYRLTQHRRIDLDFSASSLDELTGRLSDGFYTTFSTLAQGTKVLGLKAHFDRLYQPAKELGLPPSADEQTVRKEIVDLAWLESSL